MPLQYIDRFHPHLRQEGQRRLEEGHVSPCDELALLEHEQLQPLVTLSLRLLIFGSIIFVLLDVIAYSWQRHTLPPLPGAWSIALWLFINIISYFIILPIHEILHALAFLLLGGKPHFGARLPLALYCGAREQVFPRNYYLVVGLTPLVIITLIGIILTFAVPSLTSYLLLAFIGNVSGAAGDVLVATRLLHLPKSTLIEDTETGYRAWEFTSS